MATLVLPEPEVKSTPPARHYRKRRLAKRRSGEGRSRLIGLSIAVLACACLAKFFHQNLPWLRLFPRDVVRLAHHPQFGQMIALPAHLALAIMVVTVAVISGWFGATLVLIRTPLQTDRVARLALAVVLGLAILGYLAMAAVIAGQLRFWVLYPALAITLVGLYFWQWRTRRKYPVAQIATSDFPIISKTTLGRLPRWTIATLSALIVLFTLIHAGASPVTEWDSIVYHASTARYWYLHAPNPPLLYGPSVGIEISANYPPLFPAIGAGMYAFVGAFDDFYLRLVSPILFAATSVLLFRYTRVRFSANAAWIALACVMSAPLLVMYAAWPTGYMLLTTLTLVSLMCCDFAGTTQRKRTWAAAGVVAGLAMLTHFFGWLLLPIGVATAFVYRRSLRQFLQWSLVFVGSACVVAAPWLIRNLLRLHDPLYPLGSPLFHGKGLTQPLWNASEGEISTNAKGYWFPSQGIDLRGREIFTALADRHLLPLGVVTGLLVGVWLARRNRSALVLLLASIVLIGAQIVPGWYWLRSLASMIPVVAILTGAGIATLMTTTRRPVRLIKTRQLAATLIFGIVMSTTTVLAFAGPNQDTWTTDLNHSPDLLANVRQLGEADAQLETTFSGDYGAWQWLNAHLASGGKVATLDVRNYYFDNPDSLFYMDGTEGIPLLSLNDSFAMSAYLVAHDVRYVMMPSWSVASGPAQYPLVNKMPLVQLLGSASFPEVAAFVGGGSTGLTQIYSVGGSAQPLQPIAWSNATTAQKNAGVQVYDAQTTTGRIFVPLQKTDPTILSFDYKTNDVGPFSFNLYKRDKSWTFGAFSGQRSGLDGWAQASITLQPGDATDENYANLGVFTPRDALTLRNIHVLSVDTPLAVSSNGGYAALTNTSVWTVENHRTNERLYLPLAGGSSVVQFQYHDITPGEFDVNLFDAKSKAWSDTSKTQLVGDGQWKTLSLTLAGNTDGLPLELGMYSNGNDVMIRNLQISPSQGASPRSTSKK